jgi:hypothetical protein
MDDQMVHRLREQAQSLRAVIGSFEQASRRVAGLGSGIGWLGPASVAYDTAIGALRIELYEAELHLAAALRDTISAIGAAPLNPGQSRGG